LVDNITIRHTEILRARIQSYGHDKRGVSQGPAAKAQVTEFLRTYAGPKSSFLGTAANASGYDEYMVASLTVVLDSFVEYLRAGLHVGMSPERRAKIDVVSDILGQAALLLQNPKCHPAAAAVLIGASLEEYLRNWVEAEQLSIGNAKPGIEAYGNSLRKAELIDKQDGKDITAWGGTRNQAAHGEWDKVADPARIQLMLEGVNLFMRQKSR
jgi:hypothetical protein